MSLKRCHHQNKESLPTSSNPYFSCATCNLKPKPRAFGWGVGFGPGASSRGGVVSCGVVNPDDRSTNLIDPVDGVMLHLWCFFWYNYWISLNIEYNIDTSRRKNQGFSLYVFFETMRSENWGFNLSCVLTEKQWRKFVKTCISGLVAWKRIYSPIVCWLFWKTGKHIC